MSNETRCRINPPSPPSQLSLQHNFPADQRNLQSNHRSARAPALYGCTWVVRRLQQLAPLGARVVKWFGGAENAARQTWAEATLEQISSFKTRAGVARKQISSRIILGGRVVWCGWVGGWREMALAFYSKTHTHRTRLRPCLLCAAAAEFLSVGAGLNLFAAQKVVLRGPLIKRRASPGAPLSLATWFISDARTSQLPFILDASARSRLGIWIFKPLCLDRVMK